MVVFIFTQMFLIVNLLFNSFIFQQLLKHFYLTVNFFYFLTLVLVKYIFFDWSLYCLHSIQVLFGQLTFFLESWLNRHLFDTEVCVYYLRIKIVELFYGRDASSLAVRKSDTAFLCVGFERLLKRIINNFFCEGVHKKFNGT